MTLKSTALDCSAADSAGSPLRFLRLVLFSAGLGLFLAGIAIVNMPQVATTLTFGPGYLVIGTALLVGGALVRPPALSAPAQLETYSGSYRRATDDTVEIAAREEPPALEASRAVEPARVHWLDPTVPLGVSPRTEGVLLLKADTGSAASAAQQLVDWHRRCMLAGYAPSPVVLVMRDDGEPSPEVQQQLLENSVPWAALSAVETLRRAWAEQGQRRKRIASSIGPQRRQPPPGEPAEPAELGRLIDRAQNPSVH